MNCRDLPFVTSIWIICLIADVTGVITAGPSNAVAKVEGQTIFNCTSSITLQNWIFAKSRGDLGTLSAQNIAIDCNITNGSETHYEVDRPGGSNNTCNLIVKATTMQQAGIYTCSDTVYGPSALLTVIDPIPVITSSRTIDTVDGESVIFECKVNYNGTIEPTPTLRPYFYWTNSTGENVTSSSDSTTNDTAVSQITVTAQRENNMTAYTCHVYFILNPQNTLNYVSNTPTVNISATSSTIEVLFSHPVTTPSTQTTLQSTAVTSIPHTMTTPSTSLESTSTTSIPQLMTTPTTTLQSTPTISNYPIITSLTSTVSSTDNCVYKEETLTCTADANPPAEYEWLDLINDVVTSGATKAISSGGQYQCIAFNSIRGQRYNDTKIANLTTCAVHKYCYAFKELYTCILVIIFSIYFGLGGIFGVGLVIYIQRTGEQNTFFTRFLILKNMLPCLKSETTATLFQHCLWITLYIVMVITVGFFVIPIMLIIVSFHKP